MKRRNPFPGVSRVTDRHGKVHCRFRRQGFTWYLPGAYGSPEFRAAYDVAEAGAKAPTRSTAEHGTVSWLVEEYLRDARYQNLPDSRKRTIRAELDWLRGQAGKYHFARLEVRHAKAIKAKKAGPTAANTVKKNMSMLFNFASKKLGYTGPNPAPFAEKRKIKRTASTPGPTLR